MGKTRTNKEVAAVIAPQIKRLYRLASQQQAMTESSQIEAWIENGAAQLESSYHLKYDGQGIRFKVLDVNLTALLAEKRKQLIHARLAEGVAMEGKR